MALNQNSGPAVSDVEKVIERPEPTYQQPDEHPAAVIEKQSVKQGGGTRQQTPMQAKRKFRLSSLHKSEVDNSDTVNQSEVTLATIDSATDSTFSNLAKKGKTGDHAHGRTELLRNRSWAALTSGIADCG
ncbi:hypothetical protein LTR08_008439 [Meristemomyces frigidus]|nr:hypothetical protein LTR08_008439 [Meristemomyces frigidus]